MDTVWIILIALGMLLAGLLGVVLTILTFPGVWLTLLVAIGFQFAYGPDQLFSWYTLGFCVGLALLAEVLELISSAAGATRSGGGRSGAIGAIVGSTVGALAGTFVVPIPVVGTIVGAVAGAALGAIAGERGIAGRTWEHSLRIGVGAAKGRFWATIIKTTIAGVVALILLAGVIIPGPARGAV